MYFSTYGLRKTWLDKCLKTLVSEDPLTSKMENGPKNFWNFNHNTFTIFIDPSADNRGWKSHHGWYAKSYDSLLTHWVPMTSILFITKPVYCNIFICNYLRKEKYFLNFLFTISKFRLNFEHFQKKDDPLSSCIFELRCSEKRG